MVGEKGQVEMGEEAEPVGVGRAGVVTGWVEEKVGLGMEGVGC